MIRTRYDKCLRQAGTNFQQLPRIQIDFFFHFKLVFSLRNACLASGSVNLAILAQFNLTSVTNKRFISEQQLLEDAYKLGIHLFNSGFRPTFIVGLWRGGSTVGIAVQEYLQYLGVKTDHIAICISYRGLPGYQQMVDNAQQENRVYGSQFLLESLNQEDALPIVDDVFISGLTTSTVVRRLSSRLKNNKPQRIRIAMPWLNPNSNRTRNPPDFYLHEADDWLVMPYEIAGLSDSEINGNKTFLLPFLDTH